MIQYLAYPLVLLIVSLVFMLMFKRQLGSTIERIHKIGPTGFEAVAPSQQIAVESITTDHHPNALHPATPNSFKEFQTAMAHYSFATATRKEREFKSSADIDSMTNDQLKAIMTQVAGLLMMAYEFENTYNLIFGSQIRLLQDLNSVFGIGRPMEFVRGFYDSVLTATPNAFENFPFEQWLEFLRGRELIVADSTTIVRLTEEGRDFLRYMVQIGKSPTKPF